MTFDPEMYPARRARDFAAMKAEGGGALLLPAAEEKLRNADAEYLFRQDSDYAWDVGLDEPSGCALFLARGGERNCAVRAAARPGEGDLDRPARRRRGREGALSAPTAHPWTSWTCAWPGASRARGRSGTGSAGTPAGRAGRAGAGRSCAAACAPASGCPQAVVDARDPARDAAVEVARRRSRSCARPPTSPPRRTSPPCARPGRHEYEMEALIDYTFRRRGGTGPGYGSIVGGGANATILHYASTTGAAQRRRAVLIDAGCEVDGYTADVTRTFPVAARFTSRAAQASTRWCWRRRWRRSRR